jgi:hypothetical protein
MIKTPQTNSGSALQSVQPLAGGIDGAPLAVTAVANVSTNQIVSDAFYIFSTTPLHFRTSFAGTLATVNDTPIPANIPLVFACNSSDRISVIKMAGAADGNVWIHTLAQPL